MARIQTLFRDVKRETILDKEVLYCSDSNMYRNTLPSSYIQEILQLSYLAQSLQSNNQYNTQSYLDNMKEEIYNHLEVELRTQYTRTDVLAFAIHSKKEDVQLVIGLYNLIVEKINPIIQKQSMLHRQLDIDIQTIFRDTLDLNEQVKKIREVLFNYSETQHINFVFPSMHEIVSILNGNWRDDIGKKIASLMQG